MTMLDSAQEPAPLPAAAEMFPDHPAEPAKAASGPDELPFAHEMFPDRSEPHKPITGALAKGPVGEWLFGNTEHSSLARIMHAFGEGYSHVIGEHGENLKLSEGTETFLKEKGVFNDYAAGQASLLRSLNETWLRRGAVVVNSAIYGVPAIVRGIDTVLTGEAETSGPAQTMMEAFPLGPKMHVAMPHGAPPIRLPEPLAAARDLDVIGPGGEAAWKGTATVEAEPHPVAAETAAREAPASLETPTEVSKQAIKAPPVKEGFVRFYHGGGPEGMEPPTTGGGRWTSTEFKYAQMYRSDQGRPGEVWYVDIPKGDPTEVAAREWDELDEKHGLNNVGHYRSIEIPEHWAKQMKPVQQENVTAPPALAPDVHAVARILEPKTFEEFDALAKRRDIFRKWIDEMDESARPEADAKRIAVNLRETEARMRELEPAVTAAYAKAREGLPTEAENVRPGAAAEPTAVAAEPAAQRPPEAAAGPQAAAAKAEGAVSAERGPPARLAGEAQAQAVAAVDRTHDVPYLAGTSNDGKTVYIDKRVPAELTVKDKTFDPAKFLTVHESTEHELMVNRGEPYETAHREALKAERAAVESAGIDWNGYQEQMAKLVGETEHAHAKTPPTDLYTKPYPHREAEFLKREGEGGQPAVAAKPVRPIAEQKAYIAADVERQLIAAGKPAEMPEAQWREHAKLAGQLAAARYEARAAHFNGARGTAEDLYNAEAAEVVGHGQRAQGAAPRTPRKIKEESLSLLQFLAHKGGIQETPDLRHVLDQNPFIPGFGRLLRKSGMTLDRAREAASEAGYLAENQERTGRQATMRDLFDALSAENRGRKVYRQGHEPEPVVPERPDASTSAQRGEFPEGLEPHEMAAADEDQFAHLSEEDRVAMELFQSARGSVQFREGQAPLMRILRAANASTFVHESGHVFLEELMRDAAHEAAPAQLVADAKTVRDWLGIESHDDLNTGWPGARGRTARAAHEKFATGFEQYLREGVAPSKELAAVFARFRGWLMKLYDTIAGLGHPIPEEIRGVFDRLLAHEPERTTIAPEHKPAESFADIHEAHAEATPPERAREVANTIQAERDSQAAENLIEGENARLENVEPGIGSRAPGSEKPPGHADETGPEGGPTGNAAEPGKIGAGGSEAAPEGNRAPPAAGPTVKIDVPPRAGNPFGLGETERVDKIGNFRIDGINLPEDVDAALREAAERRNGFVNERRGVVTDGQALDLALASGMDTAWLDLKKIGDAYSKEEIFLLEHLFSTAATAVKDTAIAAKSGETGAILAHAEAMARLEMLQAKLAGATAEAGRSLAAIRSVVKATFKTTGELSDFLKANTGRTLFQLQEQAAYSQGIATPAQIARMVNDTKNGKIKQAMVFYYVNALLSGPVTHLRYFVGNALTALYDPLVRTPIAAGIDFGLHHAGFQAERRVFLGESGAQLYALSQGSADGLRAALEGWKTGYMPHLGGEGQPELFGQMQGPAPIPGRLGAVIGAPTKAVAAIHGASAVVRYSQEIRRLAYRAAMQEKLEGDAFTARVAELSDRPPQANMEAAAKVARSDLYMAITDYNSFSAKLSRLTDSSILAKLMLPFVKIGIQVESKALANSPAALAAYAPGAKTLLPGIGSAIRDDLNGVNGPEARNMRAASIIGGTALMGATAAMVANGEMTGHGPHDKAKRDIWLSLHKPYTVAIGPLTLNYSGWGYLGKLMAISANAYETHQGWGDEDGHSIASAYYQGFQEALFDDSFLRGVKDFLDAKSDPDRYGARYAANMLLNWAPFSVGMGQVARLVDPYQRETHTSADSALDTLFKAAWNKVPFASQGLYPRRDVFGEPIRSGGNNPNYANDATVKLLDNLHIGIGDVRDQIRGVKLTDKQFDEYAMLAGRTLKQRLDSMMQTVGRKLAATGRPEDRAKLVELVHKIVGHTHEQAAKSVMMHAMGTENDIVTKAKDAKAIKKGLKAPETVH